MRWDFPMARFKENKHHNFKSTRDSFLMTWALFAFAKINGVNHLVLRHNLLWVTSYNPPIAGCMTYTNDLLIHSGNFVYKKTDAKLVFYL